MFLFFLRRTQRCTSRDASSSFSSSNFSFSLGASPHYPVLLDSFPSLRSSQIALRECTQCPVGMFGRLLRLPSPFFLSRSFVPLASPCRFVFFSFTHPCSFSLYPRQVRVGNWVGNLQRLPSGLQTRFSFSAWIVWFFVQSFIFPSLMSRMNPIVTSAFTSTSGQVHAHRRRERLHRLRGEFSAVVNCSVCGGGVAVFVVRSSVVLRREAEQENPFISVSYRKVGRFSPALGAIACTACPAGTFTSSVRLHYFDTRLGTLRHTAVAHITHTIIYPLAIAL